MRLLGLDVGDKRIGVAFGDDAVKIATPVQVIARANIEQDARAFAELAHKYDAERLIVGLPRNLDGTLGPQAEAVIAYIEKISRAINLPITFWDECLTTIEATQRRNATGARGKKSRAHLDAIAAAVILQDYLDSQAKDLE